MHGHSKLQATGSEQELQELWKRERRISDMQSQFLQTDRQGRRGAIKTASTMVEVRAIRKEALSLTEGFTNGDHFQGGYLGQFFRTEFKQSSQFK